MSCIEQQEEELEVLKSIFEDDEAFKFISEKVFQYKFGDDGTPRSFIVEFGFTDSYPEAAPNVNLDAFYNNHILPNIKVDICKKVDEFAESLIGEPMVYSLIDFVKDDYEDLISEQPLK